MELRSTHICIPQMALEGGGEKTNNNGGQVLLVPFMAQGHLIPFLSLATLLDLRTPHTITIINTAHNIQRLRSSLPPNTTIRFAELPFNPSDHGLPPTSESTDSTPPHLFLRFFDASESLQPHFHRLLSSLCSSPRRPLCIISDEFTSWSVQSAAQFGVPNFVFNTSGAYGTAIFMSVWTHLPHKTTTAAAAAEEDDVEFPLPDFPETTLRLSQLSEACRSSDGNDPWAILFRKQFYFFEQTDGVIVNTVEELELKGLEQLRRKSRFGRVWAIGPLSRPSFPSIQSGVEASCIDWLHGRPPASVLYISFGSQTSINPRQMMELAKGLESSGHFFIWVIRPPTGFDLNEDFRAEWLPEGFEERVQEREQGILVRKWAPQMEILGHESTGGFLSHCGWNSVVESLSFGVPIVGWPMGAEQAFNSKLVVEELGAGVEMANGSKAEIRSDEVRRVVGWVMDGESEKGREMRRKAKELAGVIRAAGVDEEGFKGSSVRAIEDFIQTALSRREN